MGHAGIPVIASGRTRQEEIAKLASSNRSNFFPSFDSRGNVGIIEDSNEFSPKKQLTTIKDKAALSKNNHGSANENPSKDLSGRVKHGSK